MLYILIWMQFQARMVNFEIMTVGFLFVTTWKLCFQIGLEFTSVMFLNYRLWEEDI